MESWGKEGGGGRRGGKKEGEKSRLTLIESD